MEPQSAALLPRSGIRQASAGRGGKALGPVRVFVGATSRRAVLRGLTSAMSVVTSVVVPALALGGCESMASVNSGGASEIAANRSLLVATTRKAVKGARGSPWFGTERWAMTVARAQLTPPDD